jgi:NTP pyrophosphatase (non-canonical NTP hydrolase)
MSSNIRETYVTHFQKAMGQSLDAELSIDLLQLRMDLIKEEVRELEVEVGAICYQLAKSKEPSTQQLENMVKELTDVMYVTSGFAVTFGISVQPAFARVHKSNMTKLVDGKPMLRDDGKVIKGPNYKPPTMKGLI